MTLAAESAGTMTIEKAQRTVFARAAPYAGAAWRSPSLGVNARCGVAQRGAADASMAEVVGGVCHDLAHRSRTGAHMSVDYRTAWTPFDQNHGQTPTLLALAVEWVEQECAEQGRVGLLITPDKDISLYAEPIQDLAARHEWITRRGGMRRRPAGGCPVLVHCPMFDDLRYAADLARGSSLCATEWPDVPLAGRASARGALNLVTGEATPRPADDVARLLDHLHFAGNNGWFDRPGMRDAVRLLSQLRTRSPLGCAVHR